jgi:DNA-binding PucR family transcriptional regulator
MKYRIQKLESILQCKLNDVDKQYKLRIAMDIWRYFEFLEEKKF